MRVKYVSYLTEEGLELVSSGVQVAIDRAGGRHYLLSKSLGLDKNLPTYWMNHTRIPTIDHALAIELILNVSRKSIRPDIDWAYIREDRIRFTPRVRAAVERALQAKGEPLGRGHNEENDEHDVEQT